jgi:hypothetical protein
MTVLSWLRRLLEDVPRVKLDSAYADGERTDFYVTNPPAANTLVAVNGQLKALATDYDLIDDRGVRFLVAPATDAQVVIQYERQTWPDDELDHYIEQALQEWDLDRHVVYRAAIYAIDTLLIGLATGMNFGAGAEAFDIASVFARMQQLRALFLQQLAAAMDEPSLAIIDVTFPSRDPFYPGGFYGGPLEGEDLYP